MSDIANTENFYSKCRKLKVWVDLQVSSHAVPLWHIWLGGVTRRGVTTHRHDGFEIGLWLCIHSKEICVYTFKYFSFLDPKSHRPFTNALSQLIKGENHAKNITESNNDDKWLSTHWTRRKLSSSSFEAHKRWLVHWLMFINNTADLLLIPMVYADKWYILQIFFCVHKSRLLWCPWRKAVFLLLISWSCLYCSGRCAVFILPHANGLTSRSAEWC